ncbi:MAG: hypothetical protein IJV34_05140 [Prevotella sp.]|nr:hypothetical protein [Prevotella sp.]
MGHHTLTEHFGATGKLSWKRDFGINIPIGGVPVCPYLQFFIEPGLFIKAEVELSSQLTYTHRFNTVFNNEYSSREEEVGRNINQLIPVSADVSGEAMLDGNFAVGVYFEFGVQAFKKKDLFSVSKSRKK